MKKLVILMALAAVAGLMLTAAPQEAQARLQYNKALAKKYEKAAEKINEKKCAVCHGDEGKDKKVRSDYAKAVAEALGAKNVKEEDKINAAFDKAGKKDAGNGKSYDEILKAGELPPPAKKK